MSGGERGHRHRGEAETGPRPKGIERFVAGAYRRRMAVHAMVGVLVLSGLWAWNELPVEAFPDLTNNQAVVVTEAPGLSATEVEQQVTYPIETALMGVPRSQEVRSLSKFGLSIVTIVFDDDVPVYFAPAARGRAGERRARSPPRRGPSRRSARWRPPSARSTSTSSRGTSPTR